MLLIISSQENNSFAISQIEIRKIEKSFIQNYTLVHNVMHHFVLHLTG